MQIVELAKRIWCFLVNLDPVTMTESGFAGLIAALVATALLGVGRGIYQWWTWRQDVKYIRDLLVEGRKRVLDAKDIEHKEIGARSLADDLRAAQYNNMIKQVGVALEQRTVALTHRQRKEILDALDWYHTESLNAVNVEGRMQYVKIPDGDWPTPDMSLDHAKIKFAKLQSIRWLKLDSNL